MTIYCPDAGMTLTISVETVNCPLCGQPANHKSGAHYG